ncbi:hypothetical protein HNP29_004318 [Pseudomonas alcaligenes]|nr:hypothetical protein [Pseudomonas alcaligenes]
MAEIGFRGRNDWGTTQIDSDYQNYMLVQKGTATFSPLAGYIGRFVDIALPSERAMVAVRSSNGFRLYGAMDVGGTYVQRYLSITTAPSTLTYYIFDTDPPRANRKLGFRLRRADGKICYDSNDPVMSVVGVFPGPGAPPWPMTLRPHTDRSWTYPASSEQLALVISGFGYAWWGRLPEYIVYEEYCFTSNSSITIRRADEDRYGYPGPEDFDSGRASGLVLDVSKL